MDFAPFLLLALVGGYAFSTILNASVYYSSRENGHRLYFRAAFYGLFLVTLSLLFHLYFYSSYETYRDIPHNWLGKGREISAFSSLWIKAVLIQSVVLSVVLPFLLNLLTWPCHHFILKQAISHNEFEKLIHRSFYKDIPILLTLSSRKVFVGWAVAAPRPSSLRKYVRILPLLSGYRAEEKQEVEFTVTYYKIYEKYFWQSSDEQEESDAEPNDSSTDLLEAIGSESAQLDEGPNVTLEDFEIVLPIDEIVSAHLFDLEAYNHFKDEQSDLIV